MSEAPFEACWHRLDRAKAHRIAMTQIWNDFITDHPYDTSLDHEGNGVFIFRVWRTSPIPPELAVITGEWLYNLRCALDYIVWATACYQSGAIPPPNEGTLQYPIYESADAWTRNLYRLKPLAEHHRAMLEQMQPFNSDPDSNYLGWINRLARIDRHRRLSIVTSYLAELNPVLAVPDGCDVTLQWGSRVLDGGKADVARIVVTPWQDDLEVLVNPRSGIDPEIAEWAGSAFWSRIPYSERFRLMQVFVATEIAVYDEIAVYEYDCTGSSRKASVLTENYKAECDARRSNRPITPRRQPRTEWGPALPGRPSTREAFRGDGFPSGPARPDKPW